MKKILMLVLFATFAISGFAKEEVSTPDTTAVTFTQFYNDVKEGITSLGIALKVPAEHVYGVLVKQQFVNSVVGCLLLVLTITNLIVLILVFPKCGMEDPDKYDIIAISSGVFFIIFFMASIVNFQDTITGFMNPEYGAIRDIMSFIK